MANLLIERSASLSPCGTYRWWLQRDLVMEGARSVCFLMLNPSKANAEEDDPTVTRCIGFAMRWGYSRLVVRNLFPFIATNPKELLKHDLETLSGGARGVGELAAAANCDTVVAAWGAKVPFEQDKRALWVLQGTKLWCLGKTKHGQPRHPLFVRANKELEVFRDER